MTTEKQEAKADWYLTEGRVCVVEVSTADGYGEFLTRGSLSEPYRTIFKHGEWNCDCPAHVPVCVHVIACQKITKFDEVKNPFTGDDDASKMIAEFLGS